MAFAVFFSMENPSCAAHRSPRRIRRASSSIPINISEGCGRGSNKDFARFLQIAIGSACEVEYELLLAKELKYIEDQEYHNLSKEVVAIRKMIIKYQSELN